MDDKELLVKVATTLDILVTDFKDFKQSQEKKWVEFEEHSKNEERYQANINSTIYWHNIIGKGVITALLSYGIFIYYYVKDVEQRTNILEANGAYYYNNREVTIRMIEDFKDKKGL